MNTIDILNQSIELNESGIKIPKGTVAAKIVHHQDLDGVMSAIVTYRQLLKQGLKPKNIKIDGIQYNNDSKMSKLLKKQKGQMVAVVDFAAMPSDLDKKDIPDFWSDHHIARKNADKKVVKKNIKLSPEDEKKLKLYKEQLKKLEDKKDLNSKEKFNLNFLKRRISKLENTGDTFGRNGSRIGATEYKSDFEHIATLHTNNMIDSETVKAISIVDSAGYTNIKDTFLIRKDFKEKNRMERLAIIVNAMMSESGLWNNSSVLEGFIKKTNPSLVSVYHNLLDYVSLNNVQKQGIRELAKPNPDWDLVEKIRKAMPDKRSREAIVNNKQSIRNRVKDLSLSKEQKAELLRKNKEEEEKKKLEKAKVNEGAFEDREELLSLKNKKNKTSEDKKRIKELVDPVPKIRERREASLKKHTNLYKDDEKSKFIRKKNVTFSPSKTQRYLWSLLQKNGIRSPFTIRNLGSMVQVSINPDIPEEIKSKIDLNKIREEIMDEVKKDVNDQYKDWAFEIIENESGGHKGITNISNLHLVGLAPKKVREELKYIKSFEDRIKKLKVYGYKKLSDEDREKFHKASAYIKKMKDKESFSKEDKDLFKRLNNEFTKLMNNKQIDGKVFDEYDKWVKKNSVTVRPKGDQFKDKENLKLKSSFKTINKMSPEEENKLKEAIRLRNIYMPTLERLFPEKAKRKEELLQTSAKYKEQGKKIKDSIVSKFEKRIDDLVKEYKIKVTGNNPEFEINQKSKLSKDELDKLSAKGRSKYKSLSLKEKDAIKKKMREKEKDMSEFDKRVKDLMTRRDYTRKEAEDKARREENNLRIAKLSQGRKIEDVIKDRAK